MVVVSVRTGHRTLLGLPVMRAAVDEAAGSDGKDQVVATFHDAPQDGDAIEGLIHRRERTAGTGAIWAVRVDRGRPPPDANEVRTRTTSRTRRARKHGPALLSVMAAVMIIVMRALVDHRRHHDRRRHALRRHDRRRIDEPPLCIDRLTVRIGVDRSALRVDKVRLRLIRRLRGDDGRAVPVVDAVVHAVLHAANSSQRCRDEDLDHRQSCCIVRASRGRREFEGLGKPS